MKEILGKEIYKNQTNKSTFNVCNLELFWLTKNLYIIPFIFITIDYKK